MAGIAVSTQVTFRNNMGQFIADCEAAARDTIDDLVTEGANLSKAMAPKRTGELAGSIEPVVLSRTSGLWRATANHALPQEFGAGPHPIVGNPFLAFFWEAEGRDWEPGLMGVPDVVSHPGNPAHPYLRPAYRAVWPKAVVVADRHYPG